MTKSAVSAWKKGAVPRDGTLARIADYFKVPVESLTAGEPPDLPSASAALPALDELFARARIRGAIRAVLVVAVLAVGGSLVAEKDESAELPERGAAQTQAEETAQAATEVADAASEEAQAVAEESESAAPEAQPEPEPEPEPQPEPEPEPAPEPEPEPEPQPEPEQAESLSVDACVSLFKISLASSYGENYSVEQSDNIVMIYVWGENVTLGAFAAKGGNQEALDAWNVMMENLKELSLTYEGVLKDNGHSDVHVSIGVQNDLNKENMIASVLSGVVIYDIVNDIAVNW